MGDNNPQTNVTSEDCLYLDVFAPSNATNTSALPVFFFIQGGGFVNNANPNINGRGLIMASEHNMVVVTSNYRVGPYGFLSGTEVTSQNNGLKDQRKALEWVQKYIAAFGGNPHHVVLGGGSAGAASIAYHLAAYGGRNDGLFHAAAAGSVSTGTQLTVDESQYLYDNLVNKTGCSSSAPDTLSCLRKLPASQIQNKTTPIPFPGRPGAPLFAFSPVIDGDLIQDYTYRAFNSGRFLHVPTIFGDDQNGGTMFAPKMTSTLAQSNTFLRNDFPYLTDDQIKVLNNLYPNPNLTFPSSGPYWRQAAKVYGEMRYMCPGIFLSSAYSTNEVSSWQYLFDVQDPTMEAAGYGVLHTIELTAIFGSGNLGPDQSMFPVSFKVGGSNAEIVPMIQAYWTSFIRSLDPNKYKMTGSAKWEEWNSEKMNRFVFNTPVKNSSMIAMSDGLRARCEYLESIGLSLRQ